MYKTPAKFKISDIYIFFCVIITNQYIIWIKSSSNTLSDQSLLVHVHNRLYRNKRAQRALGRSPEEKVKGHSGANNREPQGHNLSNFGKGPFDDVIY